MGRIIFGLLTI